MSAPDPDVRVVVTGLKRREQELRALFKERAEAERIARRLVRDLRRLERKLKRLEREVKRG